MSPYTVLVIHQDEVSRRKLSQFLASDYQVIPAEDLEAAYQELSKHHVDLVILDLNLTQVDDVDVIKQLMGHYPCLRIIVTGVHSTIDEAVKVMQAGAMDFIQDPHGYLQKPFSARTVHTVVRQTLTSPHPWARLETSYDTLLKTAQEYLERQDYSQAIGFLKEALRCNPSRPEALNGLGEIEEYLGHRLEALKKYRAATDLDPTYKPAQANLYRATTQPASRPQLNHPEG